MFRYMRKKPKILVVSPMLDMGPFLPLSISMVIAILEKGGYEVKLFDTTFYKMPSKESSINDLFNDSIKLLNLSLEARYLKDLKNKHGTVPDLNIHDNLGHNFVPRSTYTNQIQEILKNSGKSKEFLIFLQFRENRD